MFYLIGILAAYKTGKLHLPSFYGLRYIVALRLSAILNELYVLPSLYTEFDLVTVLKFYSKQPHSKAGIILKLSNYQINFTHQASFKHITFHQHHLGFIDRTAFVEWVEERPEVCIYFLLKLQSFVLLQGTLLEMPQNSKSIIVPLLLHPHIFHLYFHFYHKEPFSRLKCQRKKQLP